MATRRNPRSAQYNPQPQAANEFVFDKKQGEVSGGVGFDAGMFSDDFSPVPANGVRYLTNFVNRGSRLVGRNGCRNWSDWTMQPTSTRLGLYATGKTGSTVAVQIIVDTPEQYLNQYILYSDGKKDLIISYQGYNTSAGRHYFTVDNSDARTAWPALRILPRVLGNFHDRINKKIILVTNEPSIYISDDQTISWEYLHGTFQGGTNFSRCHGYSEYDGNGILFTDLGCYKIDYAKKIGIVINTIPASSPIGNGQGQDLTRTYGRRHKLSFSRLTGNNWTKTRLNVIDGVFVEKESPTAFANAGVDYCESWVEAPIGLNNGIVTPTGPVLTLSYTFSPSPTKDNPDVTVKRSAIYSHYSLYGTKDIGPVGTDPINGVGNNPEIYTWIDDIPILRILSISKPDTMAPYSVYCPMAGAFRPSDVGNKIQVTTSPTSCFTITRYISEGQVLVAESGAYSGYGVIGGAYPYNWSAVILNQVGKSISITSFIMGPGEYLGGAVSFGDIGNYLYYEDGSMATITSGGGSGMTVDLSATKTGVAAVFMPYYYLATYPPTMPYVDVVTDETVAARMASFPLVHRFWVNVPIDCDIGVVAPGIVFYGKKGDRTVYYTQLPDNGKQFIGSYHPGFQTLTLKDGLLGISEYPGQIIFRCQSTDYTVPITSFTDVGNANVGESVSIVTQQVESKNCGMVNTGCSAYMDAADEMVITSGPAIKKFTSSSGYSTDIADGRISKILRSLGTDFTCLFHPTVGFMFWAAGRCFRYGFNYEQGIGFSEVTGPGWPIAETGVNGLIVTDGNGIDHGIIFDKTTAMYYEVACSTIQVWRDGADLDGFGGTDYEPSVSFGEDVGTSEALLIVPANTNIFTRPVDDTKRSASIIDPDLGTITYNSDGYRTDSTCTAELHQNGYSTPTASSEVVTVPKVSVQFYNQSKLAAHRQQLKLTFSNGEVQVTGRVSEYKAMDVPESPDTLLGGSSALQAATGSAIFWLARGLKTNLYDGTAVPYIYSAVDYAVTPVSPGLTVTQALYPVLTTIPAGTATCWSDAADARIGGVAMVQYSARFGNLWFFTFQGVIPGTFHVNAGNIWDLRIFNTTLTAEQLAFMYNDVVNNNGYATQPVL